MKLRTYIVALHAALFAILLAVTPAGSGSISLLGAGKPAAVGGGIAVDGTANGAWSSGTTATTSSLVTTGAGVVIVFAAANGFDVSSVSGSTLGAFTQRATCVGTCAGVMKEYFKVSAGALAGETITVTFAGTPSFGQICATAVKGTAGSPYDPNASLPGIANGAQTVSTTNATTIGVAGLRLNAATSTADTGWTATQNGNFMLCEWRNTVANSLTITDPTGAGSTIVDAVTQ